MYFHYKFCSFNLIKKEYRPCFFVGYRYTPQIIIMSYMFCRWTNILVKVILHYVLGNSTDSLWETVKLAVIIFQNAAVLEVRHVVENTLYF